MRLASEFIRLPLAFDVERLLYEASQFSEYDWDYHPLRYDGNTALSLVSVGGGLSNSTSGTMAATPALQRSPYVQQVMQSFATIIGRSRFMRLAPNKMVPPHADTEYAWRNRVRIHIPVVTDSAIRFCSIASNPGDSSNKDGIDVHMRAGEAWIFDNWREHAVYNQSDVRRIHLVIDTQGTDEFWGLTRRGWNPRDAIGDWEQTIQCIDYQENTNAGLSFEVFNGSPVKELDEVEGICTELLFELEHLKQRAPLTYAEIEAEFDSVKLAWKDCWAQYADQPKYIPNYRHLTEQLKATLKPKLTNIALGTNRVAAFDVVAKWFDATTDTSLVPSTNVVEGTEGTVKPAFEKRQIEAPDFDRPIFIISAPRAGATILFDALCNNNELWSFGDEGHREIEAIAELHPAHRNFVSSALSSEDASESIRQSLKGIYLQRLKNVNRMLYTGLSDEVRPRKIRFLDKTQDNALRIPLIKALFPQAKFVFVYREPYANVASIMEAWESQRFVRFHDLANQTGISAELKWSLAFVEGWQTQLEKPVSEIAAFQWAAINNTIIEDLTELAKDDFAVIDYQALVHEPFVSLKRICEFANIPFGPRMQSIASQPFPLSKYTLSKPADDKWHARKPELDSAEPIFEATQRRINRFATNR